MLTPRGAFASSEVRIVEEFPRPVTEIENVFIPLSDGTRLAARIWLPEDAESDPVPAVLGYIPYRKRDDTRDRDHPTYSYFAGHGHAGVRVDVRGTGDSQGLFMGEYLKQEQDDAVEVIAWLARQPWCNGSVGMIGLSYGGFTGLQIAARHPPELKAVISCMATDDRYADDVHYVGGCLNLDKMHWAMSQMLVATAPPDPEIVGPEWRETWLARLEGSGFAFLDWIEHQARDEFWKQGSACEDYASIQCAVYAVGGWADCYSNAVFRLLSNLDAPCKGLVGPWGHEYPHCGRPGPTLGFLQECVRWWDHWLKGIDTGIMNEPKLRAWIQDSVPPSADYDDRPGRWVAEESWPSPRTEPDNWFLSDRKLARHAEEEVELAICSPQTVGIASGWYCSFGMLPDHPLDQRMEAGGSLVFDSDVLDESIECLGAPILDLELSSDKTGGLLAVCLSEVLPDGAATRVSFAVLNLTHRDSHETPEALVPGKHYKLKVQLNEFGHRFEKGNRLRLAISTAYWPIAWPAPEKTTLTIYTGASRLEMPRRPLRADDPELPAFAEPEAGPPLEKRQTRMGDGYWTINADPATGTTVTERLRDQGLWHIEEIDLSVGQSRFERFTIRPEDPNSAKCEVFSHWERLRGDFKIRIEDKVTVTSSKEKFFVRATLDAWEGDARVFAKSWDRAVDRKFV